MNIEVPASLLADAIERCKQINQSGNTNASFKIAVPQKINDGDYRYAEIFFYQSVDGWMMRVTDKAGG